MDLTSLLVGALGALGLNALFGRAAQADITASWEGGASTVPTPVTVVGQGAAFHPVDLWTLILALAVFTLLSLLVGFVLFNTLQWRQTFHLTRKFEDETRELKGLVLNRLDKVFDDYSRSVETFRSAIDRQVEKDIYQTVSQGQAALWSPQEKK